MCASGRYTQLHTPPSVRPRPYCLILVSNRDPMWSSSLWQDGVWCHTHSILSWPPVVHRSTKNLLHVVLSSVLLITLSSCRFFWLISQVKVRRQVSLGLPALLLPSGLQLRACFGTLSSGILRTCPNHFHRAILIFFDHALLASSTS